MMLILFVNVRYHQLCLLLLLLCVLIVVWCFIYLTQVIYCCCWLLLLLSVEVDCCLLVAAVCSWSSSLMLLFVVFTVVVSVIAYEKHTGMLFLMSLLVAEGLEWRQIEYSGLQHDIDWGFICVHNTHHATDYSSSGFWYEQCLINTLHFSVADILTGKRFQSNQRAKGNVDPQC